VWAIQQGGFNAVIAPSFSDIFRNNCGKNGLIVVELDEKVVAKLWSIIEADPQTEITVDVEKLLVEVPSHGLSEKFAMNADTQNRFLNGLDDIAISLKHSDAITTFEKSRPTWFAAKKTN
jgi:3-isopropylmalate/(R)-2-methylmalate dehydratase small subunit